MPDVQSLPECVPLVKLKRMDYNYVEAGLAVPLDQAVVLLGLPPAAYYSSVRDLFKIGIVDVIPKEGILEVDGTKVLNGMDAVSQNGHIPEGIEEIAV